MGKKKRKVRQAAPLCFLVDDRKEIVGFLMLEDNLFKGSSRLSYWD